MTTKHAAELELDITGIAHGGTFIARHEGRVVFVSDAIPGERVRVRLADDAADKKSFWRASTVDVVSASPHRQKHIWAEADISRQPHRRVGGADLGHIELAHQRVLKQQVLQEALDKFAGASLQAPEVQAIDESDGTGWRTRVSLHVDSNGVVGPFAARSHTVIPVHSHPLARPALQEAIANLRPQQEGTVDLIEPSKGPVQVVSLPLRGKRARGTDIVETVGARNFALPARGFWQVHPHAATTLDAAVRRAASDAVDPQKHHLDLYGGVGLFTATLAELGARRLSSVESYALAADFVRRNLAPSRVTAVTGRVERFLPTLETPGDVGVVVLDPPRAGAGAVVVNELDRLRPERIIYVACDPVALARDLGTFASLGWNCVEMEAFDLFPHSHHFEVVAVLER